jgi:NTE family protein
MLDYMKTPDALVLGGGGTLGEAWMSAVLAGIEDSTQFDARQCACYVGTSAGSIVAASLVGGLAPSSRLGALSSSGTAAAESLDEPDAAFRQAFATAVELAGSVAAPLAAFASASTSVGGALLRRTLLRGVPAGERSLAELGRLVALAGVDWDGRLRIVAVEQETGRRVVFGAPEAPELSVSRAVQASCAIPGVFRPLSANGHTYVDGGVWSPTNMDVAVAGRGERVLCLNPTGSLRPTFGAPAGVLGPVSRAIAGAEALVLRNRGVIVTTINPDAASAEAMGTDLMDPARRQGVIDSGLAQGRRLAVGNQRRAA